MEQEEVYVVVNNSNINVGEIIDWLCSLYNWLKNREQCAS